MNWDAIGAIAELAGAIGVVVSLAYLATQIRHNTRAGHYAHQEVCRIVSTCSRNVSSNSSRYSFQNHLPPGEVATLVSDTSCDAHVLVERPAKLVWEYMFDIDSKILCISSRNRVRLSSSRSSGSASRLTYIPDTSAFSYIDCLTLFNFTDTGIYC